MAVRATYEVAIDLDGDRLFGATDVVTPDVENPAARGLLTIERGASVPSLLSRPKAGALSTILKREAGAYPAGGSLSRGKAVRVRATYDGTTYRLWTGRLNAPQYPVGSVNPVVVVGAYGALADLRGVKVTTPLYEVVDTGTAIGHLLDHAAFPKNDREYVLEGVTQPPDLYWVLDGATAEDDSGNGRDGTVGADVALGDTSGLDDLDRTGAKFGTTATATITRASGSGMPTGAAARTFLCRVRFGSTAGPASTAVWGYGVNAASQAFNLRRTVTNDTSLLLSGYGDDVTLTLPAGANLSDGEPHTVMVTVAADGVTASVFYDGVAGTGGTFAAPLNTGDGPLILGQTSDAGAYAYLDEHAHFAVWNGYAATAAEAAEIHSRFEQARRRLDTGGTDMDQWWETDEDAFTALVALVNTEGPGASVYEDGGGAVVFKRRTSRVEATASAVSQATLAGAGTEPLLSRPFTYDEGEVFNDAAIVSRRRAAGALGVVWTLGETVTLSAGQSATYEAQATVEATTRQPPPLKDAVAPVAATDYTVAYGSVTVTLGSTSGGRIDVIVTATTDAQITGLQLRAKRVDIASETSYRPQVDASASIAEHGTKAWAEPYRAEISGYHAQAMANAVVSFNKDGRPRATANMIANADDARMLQALGRQIGDRITITEAESGVDADFYVEAVRHEISAPGRHVVILSCTEALVGYALWGTAKWGVSLWAW